MSWLAFGYCVVAALLLAGIAQSDCGSDSYGKEVFRLNAYSHAHIDHYNLSDEIIELINMGAEITDDNV